MSRESGKNSTNGLDEADGGGKPDSDRQVELENRTVTDNTGELNGDR